VHSYNRIIVFLVCFAVIHAVGALAVSVGVATPAVVRAAEEVLPHRIIVFLVCFAVIHAAVALAVSVGVTTPAVVRAAGEHLLRFL